MALGGFFVIGIILWPLVIYMAHTSRKEEHDRRGMTTAAYVISIVMASILGLCILSAIVL